MAQDPVIKSYIPLDEEEKIEEKLVKPAKTERFSLEDERAFAVGLTTIIIIVVVLVVVGAWYLVGHFRQKREAAGPQQSDKSQILGAQDENFSQNQAPNQMTDQSPNQPSENSATAGQNQIGAQSASQASGQTYQVQPGDTLYGLGLKFKIDWEKIAQANNLEKPYNLSPGKKIIIPNKEGP